MGRRCEGKVAIVTGGGTGIGQGIALMLAQEGAQVVVASRRQAPLAETVRRIREAGGVASLICTDVRVEADCKAMVDYAVATYGGLDVLVSNAGLYPRRELPDLTQEIWDETIDVNLRGHFFCAKHAIPALIARGGGGSIIFIGSVHGYKGGSDVLAYSAAKGGLWIMTRNLARTYAPQHIRVNYVNPGWVASEGEVLHRRELGYPDTWLEEQGRQLPMGRLQTPEDTAYVCVLLASDESTQLTATQFNVDGALSVVM